MVLEVAISKQADTTLRAISRNVAERVIARIEQYAADPDSLAATVRRLRGSRALRLRVGDWRVIFTAEGDTMTVIKVGPRGSVTRWAPAMDITRHQPLTLAGRRVSAPPREPNDGRRLGTARTGTRNIVMR